MSKLNEKPIVALARKSFTPSEISAVREEVKGDFSPESKVKWLLAKKAIRLFFRKNSEGTDIREIAVVQNSNGTIPYTELNFLWDVCKYFVDKRQFGENKQLEYYDKIAQESSQGGVNTQQSMI